MYIAELIVGIVLMAAVAVEAVVMWKEKTMDEKKLIDAEINLINKMLAAHGIQAKTKSKLTMCVKSSFVAYGLQVAPGESVSKIQKIQRELSNELTRQRVKMSRDYAGRAVVRLRDYPLAIEVPHPEPTPLSWHSASMRMGPYMALIGRSYSYTGAREEYIDLDKHYHTLIAAISGGGKSTLMRMALLTLALNTSPADLRIMLIDLKNDDLVPFKALPHTVCYAGNIEGAAEAIATAHQIKEERIASGEKPYRLLLVIDELAELGADKESLKLLGRILSTGRSLGINVWAGTQYPSAAAIGSVVAASFTTRLVGMVDGKNSAVVATKRAGSGAEALTLAGDFLRVDTIDMARMKSYNIDMVETAMLIKQIVDKAKAAPAQQSTISIETPLIQAGKAKSEVEKLADTIAVLYASGASKNAMSKHAFNLPYGGRHAAKIDAAIEILVKEGSSGASSKSSSEPSSGASSQPATTSQNTSPVLVEEDRNKIIKMFPRKVG